MTSVETRARLAEIIKAESLKTGHFVLASGKTSDYYLDCRRTTLHPEGAYLVGQAVCDAIVERGFAADAVGGLTMGADPVATAAAIASHLRGTPMGAFLVRKERKQHGTGQQIEGMPPEGSKVVLVEDVITTGGSILKAATAVREAGLEISGAIVLVDREDGGPEAMAKAEIPLVSIFTARELLGRA